MSAAPPVWRLLVIATACDAAGLGRPLTPAFLAGAAPVFGWPSEPIVAALADATRRGLLKEVDGGWSLTLSGRRHVEQPTGAGGARALVTAALAEVPSLSPPCDRDLWRLAAVSGEIGLAARRLAETIDPTSSVFAMLRFPWEPDRTGGARDPISTALQAAAGGVEAAGLELVVASGTVASQALWESVMAHALWCTRGIALLEDRFGTGINVNACIELGAALAAGHHCLVLKDVSLSRLPTDFTGFIYETVDFDDAQAVAEVVSAWAASS